MTCSFLFHLAAHMLPAWLGLQAVQTYRQLVKGNPLHTPPRLVCVLSFSHISQVFEKVFLCSINRNNVLMRTQRQQGLKLYAQGRSQRKQVSQS